MAKYLLIESRDPFDSSDSAYFAQLAQTLAQKNETTVFLVQNGVLSARRGCKHQEMIERLNQTKVKVLADGFSLRERGIKNVAAGVHISDTNRLVNLLLEPGTKAIWH